MKLTYVYGNDDDMKHLQEFIKHFIESYCHGEAVDAIQVMRKLRVVWGITIDYHEIGYVLDYMERINMAEYTDKVYDGCHEYLIGYVKRN